MPTIEEYTYSGSGYNPFLIRPGWQVAQLNYAPELSFGAISSVERHKTTDEVFIQFRGRSTLISAEEMADGLRLDAWPMKAGVVYNIPAGVWHAIAMRPEDVVFIVENPNTHVGDVEYRQLSPRESAHLMLALGA